MTQLLEVAEKLKRLQAKRAAPRELIALLQKRAAAEAAAAAAAIPPQLQLTGADGGIAGAVADGAAGQEGGPASGSAVQDMETAVQPMVRLLG